VSSLAQFCFIAANKLTTAANAIVLQYTSPVFFVLFSMIFLKKKFRSKDYVVVGVTMAGIVLFFMDRITPGNMLGNFIAILSGMVFAFMYMFLGEAKDESVRISGMLVGTMISALVGIPLSFVYPPEQISLPIVLAVIGMGIFQLGIPYILYSAAMNFTSTLVCSVLASAELLLNPIWVYLLTGEAPGLWAFIGATVIAATVTLWVASDARNAKPRKPESAAPTESTSGSKTETV
jgi:drug/metabolite transporter (DMT)-like permease